MYILISKTSVFIIDFSQIRDSWDYCDFSFVNLKKILLKNQGILVLDFDENTSIQFNVVTTEFNRWLQQWTKDMDWICTIFSSDSILFHGKIFSIQNYPFQTFHVPEIWMYIKGQGT